MGLIDGILNILFGSSKNVIRETAEVFLENREAGAARDADLHRATLEAYAAEFQHARKGAFDRFMDGLNRLPRPAMALGTLGMFTAAMVDPAWFAARMRGVALVPEPLWWLLGAIVSFYFGARHQAKGQVFQQEIIATLSRAPQVMARLHQDPEKISELPGAENRPRPAKRGPVDATGNAALQDWADQNGK